MRAGFLSQSKSVVEPFQEAQRACLFCDMYRQSCNRGPPSPNTSNLESDYRSKSSAEGGYRNGMRRKELLQRQDMARCVPAMEKFCVGR